MELDELKQGWKALEQRLDESEARHLALVREAKLERARGALRTLAWGQVLRMVLWVAVTVVVARFWVEHRATPHLLLFGLVLHAYAALTLAASVRQLVLIAHVDYAAPVVVLQRQLALLRRARLSDQLWLGLPWWLLWVVATVVGTKWLTGVDVYAPAPRWVHAALALGAVGMVLTLWLPRAFAHTPRGARFLQRRLDDLAGRTLVRATQQLDELARFSRE
jgi:hypothetical protein